MVTLEEATKQIEEAEVSATEQEELISGARARFLRETEIQPATIERQLQFQETFGRGAVAFRLEEERQRKREARARGLPRFRKAEEEITAFRGGIAESKAEIERIKRENIAIRKRNEEIAKRRIEIQQAQSILLKIQAGRRVIFDRDSPVGRLVSKAQRGQIDLEQSLIEAERKGLLEPFPESQELAKLLIFREETELELQRTIALTPEQRIAELPPAISGVGQDTGTDVTQTFTIAKDIGGGRMQDFKIKVEDGIIVSSTPLGESFPQSTRFIERGRVGKSEEELVREAIERSEGGIPQLGGILLKPEEAEAMGITTVTPEGIPFIPAADVLPTGDIFSRFLGEVSEPLRVEDQFGGIIAPFETFEQTTLPSTSFVLGLGEIQRERLLERLSLEEREVFFGLESQAPAQIGARRFIEEGEIAVVGGVLGFTALVQDPTKIKDVPAGLLGRGKEILELGRAGDISGLGGALVGELVLFKGFGVAGRGVKVFVKKGAKAKPLFPQETGFGKIKFPEFEPVGFKITKQIDTLSGFKDIKIPSFDPVGKTISEQISKLDFQKPSGFDIFPKEPFPKTARAPLTPFKTTFPLEFVTEKVIPGRRPREVTFDIQKPQVIRFDIIERAKVKPTPRTEPLTFRLDPEFIKQLKQDPQRFDTFDIPKPPKPAFFSFERIKTKPFDFLKPPKKAPKKRKKAKVVRTITDFQTEIPRGSEIVKSGQQQLIQIQKQKPVQVVKLKDIQRQSFDIRQIQAQRFDLIGELKQIQLGGLKTRFKFDSGLVSLLKQPQLERQRGRQRERLQPRFKQPQRQIFKQPQIFAELPLLRTAQRLRERERFALKFDLKLVGIKPARLIEPIRRKLKKEKAKKKARKPRVPTRPSFTGIVLRIEEAAFVDPRFGVSPLEIRGLATGFEVPKRKKKK